jgi:hypothetical protein
MNTKLIICICIVSLIVMGVVYVLLSRKKEKWDPFSDAWHWVASEADDVGSAVVSAAKNVINVAESAAEDVANVATETAADVVNVAETAADEAKVGFSIAINETIYAASTVEGGLKDGLYATISGVEIAVDTVKNVTLSGVGLISSVGNTLLNTIDNDIKVVSNIENVVTGEIIQLTNKSWSVLHSALSDVSNEVGVLSSNLTNAADLVEQHIVNYADTAANNIKSGMEAAITVIVQTGETIIDDIKDMLCGILVSILQELILAALDVDGEGEVAVAPFGVAAIALLAARAAGQELVTDTVMDACTAFASFVVGIVWGAIESSVPMTEDAMSEYIGYGLGEIILNNLQAVADSMGEFVQGAIIMLISDFVCSGTLPGGYKLYSGISENFQSTSPVTGGPIYIKSTIDSSYLVLNAGQQLTTTPFLSKATPLSLTKCSSGYCLFVNGQAVGVSSGNIVGYGNGQQFYLYANSNNGTIYVGIVGNPWYLDLASKSFIGQTSGNLTANWTVTTKPSTNFFAPSGKTFTGLRHVIGSPSNLYSQEYMRLGDQLISSNGQYVLKFLINGTIAVSQITQSSGSSQTFIYTLDTNANNAYLAINADGNLQILDINRNLLRTIATNVFPTADGITLTIQNDGTLVFYNQNDNPNLTLWNSSGALLLVPMAYLKSTNGNYLILDDNKAITVTTLISQATPVYIVSTTYNSQPYYVIMTANQKNYISVKWSGNPSSSIVSYSPNIQYGVYSTLTIPSPSSNVFIPSLIMALGTNYYLIDQPGVGQFFGGATTIWTVIGSGEEFLSTASGLQWLSTSDGVQWLSSVVGQSWLTTPGAYNWLSSPVGQAWLSTSKGQSWLTSTLQALLTSQGMYFVIQPWLSMWLSSASGQAWLSTSNGQSWLTSTLQAVNYLAIPPWLSTWFMSQSGSLWLITPVGQTWLSSMPGQLWLGNTSQGKNWLVSFSQKMYQNNNFATQVLTSVSNGQGQAWLSTPSGQTWLNSMIGSAWLGVPLGQTWLSSSSGQAWLNTSSGQSWLSTPAGQGWLNSPNRIFAGMSISQRNVWLNTPAGVNWLNYAGQNWLNTSDGQSWLNTYAIQNSNNPAPQWFSYWLITTTAGSTWLATSTGKTWLATPAGQNFPNQLLGFVSGGQGGSWFYTTESQPWINSAIGQYWFSSSVGQAWLNSSQGLNWINSSFLNTPAGKAWLNTPSGQSYSNKFLQ